MAPPRPSFTVWDVVTLWEESQWWAVAGHQRGVWWRVRLTWMKVMLLGNLEEEEDEGERRGGAERGPRLTLKDRGKERRERACWNSFINSSCPSSPSCSGGGGATVSFLFPLSSTTRSCDRKCLMFCMAARTSCLSSSTPKMWVGLNLRATASVMWPVPQPTSRTVLSLNQSASKTRSLGSSSAPTRPSHLSP